MSTSDHATAQQQQQQPQTDHVSHETPHSMSPINQSTPIAQTKRNHKGRTKKSPKCTISVGKKSSCPVFVHRFSCKFEKEKNLLP